MRLDELPRSDNVEDRRGEGPGGFPMGRTGGIGIGTIILLGLIAAESRLCGARRFHPWLVRTTHALVHDRAAVGAGCKLQYLPGGAALSPTAKS